MKQPPKDLLREQLASAADELIRLRAENLTLRDAIEHSTQHLRGALAPEGERNGIC